MFSDMCEMIIGIEIVIVKYFLNCVDDYGICYDFFNYFIGCFIFDVFGKLFFG